MTSWADQFNTYEDACNFYGADTPASLAAESRYLEQEDCIEEQDYMEAHGGPRAADLTKCYNQYPGKPYPKFNYDGENADIPF